MATVLQMKYAVSENSTFGKSEVKQGLSEKELNAATPRETLDRHEAIVGGTSKEGLPTNGPYKAVGRRRTVGDGEKAELRKMGHFVSCPKGCLSPNGPLA